MERRGARTLVVDVLVGGLAGLIVGAIVAVNLVIYTGTDDGYEAGLSKIFDQNWLVGVAVILLFVTGPFVGMLVARTVRRRRDRPPS